MGSDGTAGDEEVLGDRTGAVGLVVEAVAHRDRHPVGAPRTAAVEAAAEELEAAEVNVVVEEAVHGRRGALSLQRLASDVDVDLGERRTGLCRLERPARSGRRGLDDAAERADAKVLAGRDACEAKDAAHVGQAPVARRSGIGDRRDRAEDSGTGHACVGPVEQVAAEGGRLEAERRRARGGGGGSGVAERIASHEAVRVGIAQGVAAVGVGVDIGSGGRRERDPAAHARHQRDGEPQSQGLQTVPSRGCQMLIGVLPDQL
jgi:hypothetical protein